MPQLIKDYVECHGILATLQNFDWDDHKSERRLYHFSVLLAERLLPHFETYNPNDLRPRLAVETRRKQLEGLVSDNDLDVSCGGANDATEEAFGRRGGQTHEMAGIAANTASMLTSVKHPAQYVAAFVTKNHVAVNELCLQHPAQIEHEVRWAEKLFWSVMTGKAMEGKRYAA